jgi:hypothetical protein
VKTLRLTIMVVPGNDDFLVAFLLKALFGVGTYSRVKTQDVAMLVGTDDDGVCTVFSSLRHHFGERTGIVTNGGALAAASLLLYRQ